MSNARDLADLGKSAEAIDVDASAPADSLAIDSTGNVGIGTTSPITSLTLGTGTTGVSFKSGNTSFNSGKIAVVKPYEVGSGNGHLIFETYEGGSGGGERMRIDSSGRVTMPYQPAFWAWRGGIISTIDTAVTFIHTDLNNGNHYSTSNGRFTAPVAGIYEFQAMGLLRKLNTGSSGELTLYINGSNVSSRGIVYGGSGTADDSHYPCSFTYRQYLNANDYAQVVVDYISASGADFYLDQRLGWFTGRLIG